MISGARAPMALACTTTGILRTLTLVVPMFLANVVEVKPGYSLVAIRIHCYWCARSLFGRRFYWLYWRTISDVIINEDECLTLAVRVQIEHNSDQSREPRKM